MVEHLPASGHALEAAPGAASPGSPARLRGGVAAPGGTPATRGAALIIALVILATLLLLGLPLLLSQSAGLSGSVSHRQRLATANGVASAESLGVELAVRAQQKAWTDPDRRHSSLIHDLEAALDGIAKNDPATPTDESEGAFVAVQDQGEPDPAKPELQAQERNRVLARLRVLLESTGTTAQEHTDLSAIIIDESGKIDVNSLGPAGWHAVLQGLLVDYRTTDADWIEPNVIAPDWDDGDGDGKEFLPGGTNDPHPLDSEDRFGYDPPDGSNNDFDGLTDEGPEVAGDKNHDGDDPDDWGELAEALARYRHVIDAAHGKHGKRYTDLEQLLHANPGHNDPGSMNERQTVAHGGTDGIPPTDSWGFRHPLTAIELERLRPYLTGVSTAPGRGGQADLGTVIAMHDPDGPLQSDRPFPVLDSDFLDAIGEHSLLGAGPIGSDSERPLLWRNGEKNSRPWHEPWSGDEPTASMQAGWPWVLHLPSPVNLNAMPHALHVALLNRQEPAPEEFGRTEVRSDTALRYEHDLQATPFLIKDSTGAWIPTDIPLWERLAPLRKGREQIPLSVRGPGLYTIESGAATTDARDRPLVADGHRRLWQCLPQEEDLILRWETQDDVHGLLATRISSHLDSGPRPLSRLDDARPENPGGIFDAPWLTWRTLPTLAEKPEVPHQNRQWAEEPEVPHQNRQWWIPFRGADTANAVTSSGGSAQSPLESSSTIDPEGVEGPLSYALTGAANAAWPTANSPLGDELRGQQVSFWFRLDAAWTSEQVLLHLPTQLDRQAPTWAGSTPASLADCEQNFVRLVYDPDIQCLVLEIAGPAIEHRSPYRHEVPRDVTTDASLGIDESSLGSDSSGMATHVLAPEPSHAKAKLLRHYTYVGNAGLTQDRWYHVQVAITAPAPGSIAVILDGLVGRDVTRIDAGSGVALLIGDHWTRPCIALQTSLSAPLLSNPPPTPPPAIPPAPSSIGGHLDVPSLELMVNPLMRHVLGKEGVLAGSEIAALLPASGTIWVDDECIAYTSIATDLGGSSLQQLLGCQRAVRQDHNQEQSLPADFERWPLLQEHRRGDLVMPGGMRLALDPARDRLLHGQAELLDDFGNGDPNPGAMLGQVWSRAQGTSGSIGPSDTDVKIDTALGWRANLPTKGLLRISASENPNDTAEHWFVYTSYDGSTGTFSGRMLTTTEISDDLGRVPYPAPLLWNTATDAPWLRLASLRVSTAPTAPALTDPAAFHQRIASPPEPEKEVQDHQLLIQIEHPQTGRVEWVKYDRIATLADAPGGPKSLQLFISFNGWDYDPFYHKGRARGRERTVYAGHALPAPFGIGAPIFPAASLILPVQTCVTSGHRLHTGDAVTIAPTDPVLLLQTEQALVRYAAEDGRPGLWIDKSASEFFGADVHDKYFAFTKPLRRAWGKLGWIPGHSDQTCELLVGTAVCGKDLSPSSYATLTAIRHAMPRVAGIRNRPLAPALAAPVLVLGSTDVTIDAVSVGEQHRQGVGTSSANRLDDRYALWAGPMPADAIQRGQHFVLDSGVFPAAKHPCGLALLDGEVIAWDRTQVPDPANPSNLVDVHRIIGRGLLGSQVREHDVSTTALYSPGSGLSWFSSGPRIMHLPLGPVEKLTSNLPATAWKSPITVGDSSLSQRWPEHAIVLLAKADGSAYELAALARPHKGDVFYTAPWLRGLYNTTPLPFAAGDLVIRWWPRYPSALPQDLGTMPTVLGLDVLSSALNSRAYAWVGLPSRFRGLTCLADPSVSMATGFFPELQLSARALTTGQPTGTTPSDQSGNLGPLSTWDFAASKLFKPDRFPAVDGCELRLHWHYPTPPVAGSAVPGTAFLSGVAERANHAPRISTIEWRVRAPTMPVGSDAQDISDWTRDLEPGLPKP